MDKTHTHSGQVRGTQFAVEHMAEVFRRPSLTGIEVLWRWIAGIPVLVLGWNAWQGILSAHPLEDSGFNSLDATNPWVAIVQLAGVWTYYAPHVFAIVGWLIPLGAVLWVVASGLGRNILLRRMEPGLAWVPFKMVALQGAWALLLALTFLGWFRAMQWAAATHISQTGEPDLVGFAIWSIWISLGFFVLFALISWIYSVAPVLMLLERRSALSSLGLAFRLGKGFTGKLIEINLVMGIVKLALIVLAMVFSAAPLPFSDELGTTALHVVAAGAVVFYLVANDYFQVVRLKAFVEFWKVYRAAS
jgi:hypothetical protein